MSRARGGAAIALALALALAGPAAAEPVPDLRLKAPPAPTPSNLMMRAAAGVTTAPAIPAAAPAAAPAVAAAEATVDTSFRILPNDIRDLEERVIFKVNVGYGLDSAATSGDIGKNGFDPEAVTDPNGNAFADQRQYLLGDAVLGTRGILLPSMHTYFLSRYLLDADGASQYAALNNVYDERGGQALLVSAAYAEIDDLEDDESILGRLYLRAGRQFRYGATTFITNFDGVSAGYDAPNVEVNGFVGQRVSLFFGDEPGILGGGGVKIRGEDLIGFPLDVALDYMFYDGGGDVAEDIDGDGVADLNLTRQYFELSSRANLAGYRLYLRGRVVDNGDLGTEDGFALGRAGLQLRKAFGRKLVVIGDVEQRFAAEASYDYINPAPTDVLDIAQTVGIGLDPPEDATRVSLKASYTPIHSLELYGFARANAVAEGDTGTTSGFERSWQELGAAIGHRLDRALWTTLQYKVRVTDLDDAANLADADFDNTAGTGVSEFHEIAGETRYSLGYRKLTAAIGAYYRVYNVQSPYAEVTDDGRGGARVDADYWFSRNLRAKVAGEIAQASPAFAPELDTLLSVRALMEALF
jgi:hypothetical protein